MSTLLTAPLGDEEKKKLEQNQLKRSRAQIMAFSVWLEAYKAGDIAFEALAKKLHQCLVTIGVSEHERHLILGQALCYALEMRQPKRASGGGKTHPVAFKKVAAALVRHISKVEKLPKSRISSRVTAYEHTSNFIKTLGFDVAPSTLLNWYREFPEE